VGAELPNVACKLSGLFTEHDPAGTVELALGWFGSERCMFGSDWPVSTVSVPYGETLAIVGDDPDVLARTAPHLWPRGGVMRVVAPEVADYTASSAVILPSFTASTSAP
jgi:hypothetical protein